jgi:pimeloyl-ACP methyl ester carboxylesterase
MTNTTKAFARDLASLLRLAASGTIAVSRMTEDLHRQIDAPWRSKLLEKSNSALLTLGITGLVHQGIRGIAAGIGGLSALGESAFASEPSTQNDSANRVRFLAILNGVMGDQLLANEHAWALPMQWREKQNALPEPTSRTALFIHGLCMSDLDWPESAHPASVQSNCAYLRYNSGAAIAENGARLATLIAEHTDTANAELICIAHSMGGLVLRHAVAEAKRRKLRWLKQLRGCAYLGTPHLGAPLERMGSFITNRWQALPLIGALAPIAQLRSRGIQDLADGLAIPFAEECEHYFVASTLTSTESPRRQWLGDGLVPVSSALAEGLRPQNAATLTLAKVGHIEQLRDPMVSAVLHDLVKRSL